MKILGILWKDGRLIKETTVECPNEDTRTHIVMKLLDEICAEFDLPRPIWLDAPIREFKRHSRARFRQDSFVEEFPYDILEIQVLEE